MIDLVREYRFFWPQSKDERLPGNSWSGHNATWYLTPFLILRATVRGIPEQPSGYLCDVHEIDTAIQQRLRALLADQSPPVRYDELLCRLATDVRSENASRWQWVALELVVTPFFSLSQSEGSWNMLSITRQYEFSAAHRLHCPEWSDETNRQTFGKCNHPSGHGHNYLVDVTVVANLDRDDRQPISLDQLDGAVQKHVIARLDHRHLNVDVPEFAQTNPSVENIARQIWNWLRDELPPIRLQRIRVYETAKTWAEVSGD